MSWPQPGTLCSRLALWSGIALRVQAVGLVSCEQWPEAYDILVGMVERPCGPRPELVAWGLLSHFADAALHSGHAGEGRRLVSRLGDVDGLFEYDATLAELMYATAVLSETRHADACFEVLLSHDPHRWPWLRARAYLAYGEHLRRERRVTAAQHQLVTARRLFEAMGATSLERRAADELGPAASARGPSARRLPSMPCSLRRNCRSRRWPLTA